MKATLPHPSLVGIELNFSEEEKSGFEKQK
jgi:hypothetical protein